MSAMHAPTEADCILCNLTQIGASGLKAVRELYSLMIEIDQAGNELIRQQKTALARGHLTQLNWRVTDGQHQLSRLGHLLKEEA
jgi:hypothetical protein